MSRMSVSEAHEAVESGDIEGLVIVRSHSLEEADPQTRASASASQAGSPDDDDFERVGGATGGAAGDNGHASSSKTKAAAGPLTRPLFKNRLSAHYDAFSDLFCAPQTAAPSSSSSSAVAGLCLGVRPLRPGLRPAAWALLLGLLPPRASDWAGLVESRRERYRLSRQDVLNDERKSAELSLDINNPLSQDATSPWNKYFEDTELRGEIRRVRGWDASRLDLN